MDLLELFQEYARLLRQAQLNPSYRPWALLVCQFEHEHAGVLNDYFDQWQKEAHENAQAS